MPHAHRAPNLDSAGAGHTVTRASASAPASAYSDEAPAPAPASASTLASALASPAAVLFEATLLSVASSLDNFAVGLSLGLVQATLSPRLNFIVAASNAAGAVLSSYVGAALGLHAPGVAGTLAGLIFAWLGLGEAWAYYAREDSVLAALAKDGNAWKLALPMTLNNLAGGVAGGLARIPPLLLGAGAFAASFGLMWVGRALGNCIVTRGADRHAGHRGGGGGGGPALPLDERVVAAVVFLGLAAQQLNSALGQHSGES